MISKKSLISTLALLRLVATPIARGDIREYSLFVDAAQIPVTPSEVTSLNRLTRSTSKAVSFVMSFSWDKGAPFDAAALDALQGLDSTQSDSTLTLQSDQTIEESWVPGLNLLARKQRVIWVHWGYDLPGADEVRRLNAIQPTRVLWMVGGYLGPESAASLAELRVPLQINYVASNYPRFVDRDGFLAIPPRVALNFSADYWPWYSHMDLFNLLPHPIRLRVRGIFPSVEHLDYLRAIKRLQKVVVESTFAPYPTDLWKGFGNVALEWQYSGPLDQDSAFRDFAPDPATGRTLSVDLGAVPLASDLQKLERAEYPVRVIRDVNHDLWQDSGDSDSPEAVGDE